MQTNYPTETTRPTRPANYKNEALKAHNDRRQARRQQRRQAEASRTYWAQEDL